MLNVLIVGASGYAGAELVNYMNRHEFAKIKKIFVSQNSLDIGKMFSEVHQQFTDIVNLKFESMSNFNISDQEIDVVFLATDHNVSHDLVPFFLSSNCVVFDLSASYRIKESKVYLDHYGFVHQYKQLLKKSIYGLAEWQEKK